MPTKVAIEPATAIWARERVNLTREDAATLLKCTVETLVEIEEGLREPNAGFFRKMADVYVLSEATLLGLVPIADRPLPKDFRSFEGNTVKLSYDTTVIVRRVQARQESLEALSEIDPDVVAPEFPIQSLHDDPEKLGEYWRRILGFPIVEQMQTGATKAFTEWRIRIEKFGVSVYVESLGADESRGVSIFFNRFPAIVVDQSEKNYGARNFTLFHEFCHLLLRQTGISNFNEQNRVERFCNRFAAAFLMPPEAIRAVLEVPEHGHIEPLINNLDFAAKKLCVTISQIALRLEHLNLAPQGYFLKIARTLNHPNVAPKKKSQVPWRYSYVSQFGHNFPTVVLASLGRGQIGKVDASRILEVAPDNIPAVQKTLDERKREPTGAE